MIIMVCLRFKDGSTVDMGTQELTIDKAFANFMLYELGYGGKVEFVEPTRVSCLTNVMGCIDTTFFKGSIEEMELLVEAASTHHNPVPSSSSILGFMVNMSNGVHTARTVMFRMLNPSTLEQYEKIKVLSAADLVACTLLTRKDKLALDEVLSLV